jgi:uncharacterized protein (DUF58 family)
MADLGVKDILDDAFMHKIEQLRLVSRKVIVGRIRGERLTRKRGRSIEFADYRQYVLGDDLRFLDWNLYARLEKLFLKLFHEEEDLHVYILLDTSASMGYGRPSKFDTARRVAAALAYIGLCNLDRVILGAFKEDAFELLGPLRGRRNLMKLLTFLVDRAPEGATDIEPAFRKFALQHRKPGVVIVISDFLDKGGYEKALKYFMASNQDIYIVHTLAREELDPALAGDLKLVDMEDDDVTEITISTPLLRQYRETVENFVGGLKRFAGQRGMSYLLAPTSVGFESLVLDFLRRRGLVE